jgi:hypothetical protein
MSQKDRPKKQAAQVAPSRHAQDLKSATPAPDHPLTEPAPDSGMTSTPQKGQAPSGALDAEGQRPVLERSRKVR